MGGEAEELEFYKVIIQAICCAISVVAQIVPATVPTGTLRETSAEAVY
jgi:hypothetical protein